MAGPFIFGYALLALYLAAIAGSVAGFVAIGRREKLIALAWIALAINLPLTIVGTLALIAKMIL